MNLIDKYAVLSLLAAGCNLQADNAAFGEWFIGKEGAVSNWPGTVANVERDGGQG